MEQFAMTDGQLVQASRRGDRAAFGELVERHQHAVCAVSFSATGDRALSEDVAQDTFLTAWRQLGQLREIARVRWWLCGIARNLARKARRRANRELPSEAPATLALASDPFADTRERDTETIVRDALERLPATYREVLVLYYREERSARQVAEALAISEAAVLQRLARGRRILEERVAGLVERSLESQRPRRDMRACVLAALPILASPVHVEARTTHGGWKMIKLALVTAAVVSTVGTTAYLAHEAPPPTPAVAESTVAPAPAAATAARAAAPVAAPRRTPQPHLGPDSAARRTEWDGMRMPDPDDVPTIDRATIKRLGLDRGPSRGPAEAPVTIVAFTDLMCPYCGRVLGTIDQLWDEYPGKLRLVVKQFPVHEEARLAAEAALVADAQGKFWEMHDLMMANQQDLSRDALLGYAKQAGLDVTAFAKALDSHTYASELAAQQASGKEIDVRGTPSFLINGRRFVGARGIDEFRASIEAALADR